MAKRGRPRKAPELLPAKSVLDRAKDVLDERVEASKRIVRSKKKKWDVWERMYKNEQLYQRQTGESNLVLPKADYIVEVISSKVINTIFSVSEWLTMKHPTQDPEVLKMRQKWLMYVMDKKINLYSTAIELFKGSPIKGTSISKIYMRDMWPFVEFLKLDCFLPDALANRPGDIQSMRYCAHQFRRDLNQIKNFVSGADGSPIYFNIDELNKRKPRKKQEPIKMEGVDVAVEDKIVPVFDLVEYHGEFEYARGKYGEFIITGTLEDPTSDKIETIIRLEPATVTTYDQFTDQQKFLKPFVANIYSVNPGEFYGKSAISSVESLINEQTDLHNLYVDNHKRTVNGILKVLNRSDLTRDDLQQTPGAIWFMDSFEDVLEEEPKPANLLEYKAMHELIDREIEKTSSVTAYNLGVGRTKRETYGEIRSMLSEAGDRFQLFIQMADRTTLRPLATIAWEMLRQTFSVLKEQEFIIDGEGMIVREEDLLQSMDVQFAATTIESEYSKYSKQQTFPNFVNMLATIAGSRMNVDEIVKEGAELFNFKNPERYLLPSDQIPIALLPPELQGIAQQILMQYQQQQKGNQGGQQIMAALPSSGGEQSAI